jgi:hypothetical protein
LLQDDKKAFFENGATFLVGTPGRLEEFLLGRSNVALNKKTKRGSMKVVHLVDGLLPVPLQNIYIR